MKIEVSLIDTRIPVEGPRAAGCGGAGAEVRFLGVVRGEEGGRAIGALRYEAYAGMAEAEMSRILRELSAEHRCLAARVVHRRGWVPVGEAAILVEIRSAHRAEAFAMLAGFMERLKRDVPIWKVEARAA